MSDSALVVIDVQESFRQCDFWNEESAPAFVERQQALIDGAKPPGIPMLQVFHVANSDVFSENSGFVKTLAPLRINHHAVFRKRHHSALARQLLAGSRLDIETFAERAGSASARQLRSAWGRFHEMPPSRMRGMRAC